MVNYLVVYVNNDSAPLRLEKGDLMKPQKLFKKKEGNHDTIKLFENEYRPIILLDFKGDNHDIKEILDSRSFHRVLTEENAKRLHKFLGRAIKKMEKK